MLQIHLSTKAEGVAISFGILVYGTGCQRPLKK